MPRWEYCAIHLSQLPRRVDEIDLLNDVGEEGWELVAITANNLAYLKRQLRQSVAPVAKSARRTTASDAR
jgi:hypothetical protein